LLPYSPNSVTISNFNFQNTFWTLTSIDYPLPIELINFNVESYQNKIKVFWTTASEINNDYFIVYKSYDGFNFEPIQVIDGYGNSNYLREYFTYDYDNYNGIIYYKLKQVDYDGRFEEFSIIPFDNRVKQKKVIKILNYIGQETDEKYKGFKILYYEDGSIEKRYE
jgi:hypothetical protein